MIYPNIQCYYLCVWMLTISSQRLTGSQITVTENIRDAALAQTSVTANEWQNFNEYAAWRNPYYLVYRDYQSTAPTSLLTDLENYYEFEGNSNDSHGSLNGTDSGVAYSTSYGKISQGVRNNNTSSYISIGGNSDFDYIHSPCIFTINFWMRKGSTSLNYNPLGNFTANTAKGFIMSFTSNPYTQLYLTNGSNNVYSLFYNIMGRFVFDTNWNMITFCADGTYGYFYVNGVLRYKAELGTVIAGSAAASVRIFNTAAIGGSSPMDMDELGFWSRCLNLAEVGMLYNNGNGLAYSNF